MNKKKTGAEVENAENSVAKALQKQTPQHSVEKPFAGETLIQYAVAALVLLGLYYASRYNYLLFHTLVEMFNIFVGGCIFIIAWHARRILDNNYLLFLGIAFLFIAFLNIFHTLSYKGLPIFSGYDADLPTQLWIAFSYLESIAFLIAPLFLRRRLRPAILFGLFGAYTLLVMLSLFQWRIFPSCFVEETGLTPFKIVSEYVIAAIFLGAFALLWKNRDLFDASVFRLLTASIAASIAAGLCFTTYTCVYGHGNLLGHFFNLLSSFLIYKAIVETGLEKPYSLLFRDLKRSETALKQTEAFLNESQAMAHVGSWQYDLKTRQVKCSNECYRIFGLPPHSRPVAVDDWRRKLLQAIHPDDRERAEQAYVAAIQKNQPYKIKYRLQRSDGTIRTLKARSEETINESGEIVVSSGIVCDITEREQAETRLKEVITMIDRSPIVLFRWKNAPGWPVALVTENVVDLLGYTAEELMAGRPDYESIIHREDLARVTEEMDQQIAKEVSSTCNHRPYRVVARGGEEKYVADLTTFQRNDRGEITHYEGIVWDVSDLIRKEEQIGRALKEKNTLLSEIHHRVKNNMQIITSLLRLQSGNISDEKYAAMFKDAEDRIKAMALIHERLYQSEDFVDIDFHGYVKSLAESLLRSYASNTSAIELKIAIESVTLGLVAAIPCGLFINEAISNSLKHAFPENRAGSISIDFRQVEGDLFELTVGDNGIGLPKEIDFDHADSMGLTLIKLLAEDQLDGAIELNRDGGTAFTVRFSYFQE